MPMAATTVNVVGDMVQDHGDTAASPKPDQSASKIIKNGQGHHRAGDNRGQLAAEIGNSLGIRSASERIAPVVAHYC